MTGTTLAPPRPDTGHLPKRHRGGPREGLGNAALVVGAWLLLVVVTSIARPDFLSHQTLLSITFTMSVSGVLALAQALVAVSGGILDLSIPTALILPSWLAVTLAAAGWNSWLVALVAVGAGGAWGALNASIIVWGRLNPIIVTLGSNFAGMAVMLLIFQSAQTPLHSGLSRFGRGYFLGLPNIFWPMLLLVALVGFLIRQTRYGRRAVAVGGNPAAAKSRGISLRRTRFAIFITGGALAGVGAVLFTGSNANFTPNDGTNYLLSVIAAVILAGISLSGGRGHLWMILPSVGFLSTVPVSLVFFGLSDNWQTVMQGAILVIAVAIDGLRQKRLAR